MLNVIRNRFGLILGMLAAISLTAGAMISSVASAATIGEPAPEFSVVDSNGVVRSLSDFEGQKVILEWTNSGCPFVKKHYSDPRKNMQSLQSEMTAEDKGYVWLTVISSAPGKQGHKSGEEANEHATSKGAAPTHILLDETGEMGKAYSARTTPQMYIIGDDADQTLLYGGAIDSVASTNAADIDEALNFVSVAVSQIENGSPVIPGTTVPYGCSVKYAS